MLNVENIAARPRPPESVQWEDTVWGAYESPRDDFFTSVNGWTYGPRGRPVLERQRGTFDLQVDYSHHHRLVLSGCDAAEVLGKHMSRRITDQPLKKAVGLFRVFRFTRTLQRR